MGGGKVEYPWDVATSAAEIKNAKNLFNLTISTPGAKRFSTNKNFYLNMLLDKYKYMHLHLDLIPQKIINTYKLKTITSNSWVYIEIHEGMYDLPQAGLLTNTKCISSHDFYLCQLTLGLW